MMSTAKFQTLLAYCLLLTVISTVEEEIDGTATPFTLEKEVTESDGLDDGPRDEIKRPTQPKNDVIDRTTLPFILGRSDGMDEGTRDGSQGTRSNRPIQKDDSVDPTEPMRPDSMNTRGDSNQRSKDESRTEQRPTESTRKNDRGNSRRPAEKGEDIPVNMRPSDSGSTRPCAEIRCRKACPDGYEQDDNGCDTCDCQVPVCDDAMDCDGVCGGNAEYVCEVCVGGNTMRSMDAGRDSCGKCRTNNTKDCLGVCGGKAFTDICGDCVGGTTGISVEKNHHLINCRGQCERGDDLHFVRNDCDECVRAPTNGSAPPSGRDCNGTCSTGLRRAKLDDTCDVCYGGMTGVEKDSIRNECDVCMNEENEEVKNSCFGCDNKPNSRLVDDACGNCDGNGTGCQTTHSVIPKLIPNSEGQKFIIVGAGFGDGSGSARYRRTATGVSCVIASTYITVEWPVSDVDLTNTVITCRLPSEEDPLPNGVYNITVRKDGEVITGVKAIRLTVYQPPEIVSLIPREFDAVRGEPLNFKINVTFADSAQLTQYETLVPKLIVRGDKLRNVFNVDGDGKAVLEGRVISDTVMSFRVVLKIYTSIKFFVQPSFNGRIPLPGGDDGEDGFRVTVYSESPRLESAKVQNNGDGVKVKFNQHVNTDELKTCAAIFENAERLGSGAECEWKSQKYLVVTFGQNAELGAGGSLRVNPGTVGGFNQEYSRASQDDEIPIEGPQNAQAPVAICEVPSEISSCGNLQVRGDKSRGGGKSGLKCQWTIKKNGDVDTSLQSLLDDVNSDDGGRGRKFFELNGSAIEANVEYELTLSVENPLGIRHNVSRRFRKASVPKPTVTIKVKNCDAQAARVSKALTLSAEVEYQEGCFDVGQTNFEWSWDNQDANIDEKNRFSRNLKIPAKALPGGEIIRFTVNVSRDGDTSNYAMDFIDIHTVNTDLKARILGSNSRRIGCKSSDPVVLNGSRSRDPDGDAHELRYDWTCEQTTDNKPCYLYREEEDEGVKFPSDDERGNRALDVIAGQMEPEKEYLFKLKIQKGGRFATTEVTMSCSEEEPIEIALSTDNDEGLYNTDNDIDVKAKIRTNIQVTNLTWETDISQSDLTEGDGFAYLDLQNMENLRLQPNIKNKGSRGVSVAHLNLKGGVLAKAAKYSLRVTATTEDGRTGTSAIEIRTRGGIKGCEVNMHNVYTSLERVEFEVGGCTADDDEYPLSYQVFRKYYDYGDTDGEQMNSDIAISEPTNEPRFEAIATKPNNDDTEVDLIIKICTVTDTCIAKTRTVEVVERETALSEDDKDAFFKKNVEEERQKGNLLGAVLALNALVESSTDESTRRRKRNAYQDMAKYGSLQTDLLNEIQSEGNLGSSERQAVLDQTRFLAFEYMNSTTRRKAVKCIRNLLEDGDESSESESLDIERGRNVLSSLSGAAEGINPQEDRELADEIKSAQRLVMKELSRGLSFYEEIEEETSDVNFKVVRSSLSDRLSSYTGDGAASVDFGETLKERFGTDWDCDDGRTCSDVIVRFSHYKDGVDFSSFNEEDAQTVISDIIDISIAHPETGDDIEISDLDTPVTIDIPINEIPEGKRPVGKFMNKETSAWDSEGVNTIDRLITSIHLTEFTVVTEDDPDTESENDIPVTGDDRSQESLATESTRDVDVNDADGDSKTLIVVVIVVAVAIAFILVLVLTVVVWPRLKKRKKVSPTPSKENIKE